MTKAKEPEPKPLGLADKIKVKDLPRTRELGIAGEPGTIVVEYGGSEVEVALWNRQRHRLPLSILERL